MNHQPSNSDLDPNIPLSRIRQQIRLLLDEKSKIVWNIAQSGQLIQGSFYTVYKTCTRPNCRCQKGHRHGPFPALSVSVKGKRSLIMVKQGDVANVEEKAKAYRQFRVGIRKIKTINQQIEALLEKIQTILLETYP